MKHEAPPLTPNQTQEIFLLLTDFSLFGDTGRNLKKISDLKCETKLFWEGIIQKLILE